MNPAPIEPPASTTPVPALWNPNAAGLWSVLLTPTFGAWLHMKNWEALGDDRKAATSRAWAWGNAGMIVLLTLAGMLLPESKVMDAVGRGASIGLLVGWWLSLGRVQKQWVEERFGKSYPRRSWGKPLGYAALMVIAFLLATVALAVFGEMLGGGSSSSGSGSPHL